MKALDRNEDVSILCRGKLKGVIKAARGKSKRKVSEHPFFNCSGNAKHFRAIEGLKFKVFRPYPLLLTGLTECDESGKIRETDLEHILYRTRSWIS